jgi:hypothetical protein
VRRRRWCFFASNECPVALATSRPRDGLEEAPRSRRRAVAVSTGHAARSAIDQHRTAAGCYPLYQTPAAGSPSRSTTRTWRRCFRTGGRVVYRDGSTIGSRRWFAGQGRPRTSSATRSTHPPAAGRRRTQTAGCVIAPPRPVAKPRPATRDRAAARRLLRRVSSPR